MRVIALLGPPNTGKSQTLNILYRSLLNAGWLQVPGHFRHLGNPIYNDFTDIITNPGNGKVVGFATMGDYVNGENLKRLLHYLNINGCIDAVCGCRNNPKIQRYVSAYPNHVWIPKTVSTVQANQLADNTADAAIIFPML